MHQFNFGWGFAPDPTGGAYNAPPDPLPGFKGLLLKEGKGRDRERKGGTGRGEGRKGKNGEKERGRKGTP